MSEIDIPVQTEQLSWWVLFGGVITFNTLNYGLALILDDLSIVDITWGLMFLIPNGMLMYARKDEISEVMLVVMAMITLWSLRLSIHIGRRHKGEDYRYKIIKRR